MIKITKTEIEKVSELVADSFIDDPLTVIQLNGLDKNFYQRLLSVSLLGSIKIMEAYSLDNKINSVIFCYEKRKRRLLKEVLLGLILLFKMIREFDIKQFNIYLKNMKEASKLMNLKWQKEFLLDQNYYHIQIIAIAKEERGKGIFRQLITPIIEDGNINKMPITLECANSDNVPIYQHFGFELVKTIINNNNSLVQYCFIKFPDDVVLEKLN